MGQAAGGILVSPARNTSLYRPQGEANERVGNAWVNNLLYTLFPLTKAWNERMNWNRKRKGDWERQRLASQMCKRCDALTNTISGLYKSQFTLRGSREKMAVHHSRHPPSVSTRPTWASLPPTPESRAASDPVRPPQSVRNSFACCPDFSTWPLVLYDLELPIR